MPGGVRGRGSNPPTYSIPLLYDRTKRGKDTKCPQSFGGEHKIKNQVFTIKHCEPDNSIIGSGLSLKNSSKAFLTPGAEI